MGGRFSEVGDRRKKEIETDIDICREMGWTFDELKKITVFQRNSIIRHFNKERRKLNRMKRKKR